MRRYLILCCLLAVCALTGQAAARDTMRCLLWPAEPARRLICSENRQLFPVESLRSLDDAGWNIVGITAAPHSGGGALQLEAERRPPIPSLTRYWVFFPPP
jgi:hypothetical protein